MGKIVLLDDLTINKIAAGEVIERPASVVKELVENSIDAGSKNISVEIKNGGISLIRITDDGKGIEKDDLEIAFERHATSKIRSADDLMNIASMGFRGEALASVAAISKITMNSKTEDAEIGNKIVVEGGKVLEFEEFATQKGTTISVENLFYNTPVRYKFLKKDFTESGYIEDIITHLALINKNIAFKLIADNKTILQTQGDKNIQNIIYNVFGKDIAENIINVKYEYEGITVNGVIGRPEIARSNRTQQIFFVNNRYIKDKTLSAATEQAFKGLLPINKYGFVILNLEMPNNQVDVNVHPAKLEVRFQEENKVFQAVYHSIKETLLKGSIIGENAFAETLIKEEKTEGEIGESLNKEEDIIPSQKENIIENLFKTRNKNLEDEITEKEEIKINETRKEHLIIPTEEQVRKAVELIGLHKENQLEKEENIVNINNEETKVKQDTQEIELKKKDDTQEIELVSLKENTQELPDMNKKIDDTQTIDVSKIQKSKVPQETLTKLNFEEMYAKTFGINLKSGAENCSIYENEEGYVIEKYKFIGIAFSTYILIEIKDDFYIIDQHAAHERILYEKIRKNFFADEKKDSQIMLIPDVISLSHKEMDIAKDNWELFEKAGFQLEEFGENTIKLLGAPEICIEMNTKELFFDILDEINTVARTARQEVEEKFISTVACKAAVKANMKLKEEEVRSLIDELLRLPNPFTCPHGRSTSMKISKYEIERKFSRK